MKRVFYSLAIVTLAVTFVSCSQDEDNNFPQGDQSLETRAATLGYTDGDTYKNTVLNQCAAGNHENCDILADGTPSIREPNKTVPTTTEPDMAVTLPTTRPPAPTPPTTTGLPTMEAIPATVRHMTRPPVPTQRMTTEQTADKRTILPPVPMLPTIITTGKRMTRQPVRMLRTTITTDKTMMRQTVMTRAIITVPEIPETTATTIN